MEINYRIFFQSVGDDASFKLSDNVQGRRHEFLSGGTKNFARQREKIFLHVPPTFGQVGGTKKFFFDFLMYTESVLLSRPGGSRPRPRGSKLNP